MNFESIPATIQHIRPGKLSALAVTAARRAGGGTRAEFGDYVQREIAKYDGLVKRLGIKAE